MNRFCKNIINLVISIVFSIQIGNGITYASQISDIESAIVVCAQAKTFFTVQLYRTLTKEGAYVRSIFVKKNDEAVANIILPSSEEVKNLSVKVKKYKKGCVFECFYGGGDNFYSRCFYFKCANGKLVLYQVVGTHSVVDSDKIVTEKKNIRPHINIKNFNILNYLENSP